MIVGNIGRQIRVHNLYIYEKKNNHKKWNFFSLQFKNVKIEMKSLTSTQKGQTLIVKNELNIYI